MELLLLIAINFGIPLSLIALALVAGMLIERRHFRSIAIREDAFALQPAITAREWDATRPVARSELALGSVVVSIDYFKRFMASLYNLVGGRVRSFESILDRGRREALLRMKESCPDAHIYVNLRLETSMLASTSQRGQYLGGIEVVAYATAIHYEGQQHDEVLPPTPG